MADKTVSIGEVKRDISELVNRVAYGGERIILTSRGKAKAALVSMEDYERLTREREEQRLACWKAWAEESEQLSAEILERRKGKRIDVDALLDEIHRDQEARDDQILGR